MNFWIQSMGGHSNWLLLPEYDFMIDAGEGAASAIGIGRLAALKNVFISHPHWDHVAGLFQVLNLRKRQDLGVPLTIWHPPSAKMDGIRKMVGRGYRWEISVPGQPVPVSKNLEIEPFEVSHRGTGALGFKCFENRTRLKAEYAGMTTDEISGLVRAARSANLPPPEMNEKYRAHIFTHTADTEPLDPRILGAPQILLHDATYLMGMEAEAVAKGHSSLGHALEAKRKTGARILVGLHLSPQHRDEVPRLADAFVPSPTLKMSKFSVENGILNVDKRPVLEKTKTRSPLRGLSSEGKSSHRAHLSDKIG